MSNAGFATIFRSACICCAGEDCEQAIEIVARDQGAIAVFVDVMGCCVLDRAEVRRLRDTLNKYLGEG